MFNNKEIYLHAIANEIIWDDHFIYNKYYVIALIIPNLRYVVRIMKNNSIIGLINNENTVITLVNSINNYNKNPVNILESNIG